jgi:hypothetical protein
MFDLTTIQLMNEAAWQLGNEGLPTRNAIDSSIVLKTSSDIQDAATMGNTYIDVLEWFANEP